MALNEVGKRQPARVGLGQVLLGSAVEPTTLAPEHVTGLFRLSDPALSELALESLLDQLLVRVKEILEVDTVAILLLDREQQVLVASAAKGLEEEVAQGVRIPLGKGFAGRIAAERAAIFIADIEHADVVNPILRETGVRSLLGVPLVAHGQLLGVLHVGSLRPRTFTQSDAVVLELAGARAAPAIERASVYHALEREQEAAIALQRSLLPDRLPDFVDVEVAARYLPARDLVGGDWYDVIALRGGRVGLAIGDVAGHGARAAALMGQLRAAMRAYAVEDHSPAVVLQLVDRLLQTGDHGMATAAYAVLDPATGSLRVSAAGHPPPLIVGEQGARFMTVAPRPPLGVLAFSSFPEAQEILGAGQSLLLYTDGLVEVRGEELLKGLDRLQAAATAAGPLVEALCSHVTRTLSPAEGAADDIAVLAIRNLPVPDELHLRLAAEPRALATVRRSLRRWLTAHGASIDDQEAVVLACGEACANAVEHAYDPGTAMFEVAARRDGAEAVLTVRDHGRWRAPRGKDRGRGVAIMQATMDSVEHRQTERGTEVVMRRKLGEGDGAG